MRPSHFKRSTTFHHLNIHYKTTGYFKNLDWIHLQRSISNAAKKFDVEIQVLLMMDTHFHLLFESYCKTENFFCHELENLLLSPTEMNSHSEPITNLSQYLACCKYIYNNPVEAGICSAVELYPYSSLQILLGRSASHCLISDKLGLIQNPLKVLKWLNSESTYKESRLNIQTEV